MSGITTKDLNKAKHHIERSIAFAKLVEEALVEGDIEKALHAARVHLLISYQKLERLNRCHVFFTELDDESVVQPVIN